MNENQKQAAQRASLLQGYQKIEKKPGKYEAILLQLLSEKKISNAMYQGIKSGALKPKDFVFYTNRIVSAQTAVEMIQIADGKSPGITNLNKGMLEKNEIFLLTGIQLLGGQGSGTGQEDSVAYDKIVQKVAAGDWTFKANKQELISDNSNRIFKDTPEDQPVGLHLLETPIVIESQTAIEFNTKWKSPTPSNYYMSILLHGILVQ